MAKVSVKGTHPYDVLVRRGLLGECGKIFRQQDICGNVCIVTEETVAPFYLQTVQKSLVEAGYNVSSIVLKPGECSKNLMSLQQILSFLAKEGLDRKDTLVALGGGVIGDITGFVAGIYLRGIAYVQMPTTLLAAVDSSVGGKTAIDLPEGKNLAGLFWHPDLVITDLDCFQTLPFKVYRQGMAEVVKTAILAGGELFSLCEKATCDCDSDMLETMVTACVTYKAQVVESDFTEQGVRKLLNLGHTPAHVIEKRSGYTISHGEAVARGLYLMTAVAYVRNELSEETAERIFGLLDKEKFPDDMVCLAKEFAEEAQYDKKRKGDSISLILPEGIGNCVIKEVPITELEKLYDGAMRYLYERNNKSR
ncbi:MAG: 3-dehydroquinate synthase [Lachnospiraceae bacterium]|jgi:3-dehydroquinate synthase|nr:3-dehydroquinate synthase [Lachnospiraceae bacterium]